MSETGHQSRNYFLPPLKILSKDTDEAYADTHSLIGILLCKFYKGWNAAIAMIFLENEWIAL